MLARDFHNRESNKRGERPKTKQMHLMYLQVNHNLSEIRRLFNPQIERMGNRRKEEVGGEGRWVGGGGGGWGFGELE